MYHHTHKWMWATVTVFTFKQLVHSFISVFIHFYDHSSVEFGNLQAGDVDSVSLTLFTGTLELKLGGTVA